ncbi:hypothetical protein TMS3_0103795 [Pseudomonas taeanensis MS-3]|uniref:Uncharacterized protein n=1 Tax=Pseudomonas taeanensis MS-3 TaxID=1395571 RepID=A0A0A1YMD8_9PSED|nr:hypothetical protein [Pseudomonas taeanensis]KFX71077.1 hypothetical protein TMS3_0103795 [Pseudomonas taeanensis MS-3]
MSLTLSEALTHYRSVTDATHRYWGYFQLVAGGTAAFAWSEKNAIFELFLFLSIAFTVFALLNGRLVISSQGEAVDTVQCIRNFASSATSAIPSELAPLIEGISSDSKTKISIWYTGLSLATLAAVWWRYSLLNNVCLAAG